MLSHQDRATYGAGMVKVGSTLGLFGVGSAVLHVIGMEFVLLMWIDLWGEALGWAIRGVMVVAGLGLYLGGNAMSPPQG
jgi:hypothetical protein